MSVRGTSSGGHTPALATKMSSPPNVAPDVRHPVGDCGIGEIAADRERPPSQRSGSRATASASSARVDR